MVFWLRHNLPITIGLIVKLPSLISRDAVLDQTRALLVDTEIVSTELSHAIPDK